MTLTLSVYKAGTIDRCLASKRHIPESCLMPIGLAAAFLSPVKFIEVSVTYVIELEAPQFMQAITTMPTAHDWWQLKGEGNYSHTN
jgi:hypothetical protein